MADHNNSDFNPQMNSQDVSEVFSRGCSEWEEFVMLFAAGEDFPAELHGRWIAHAAECQACTSALSRERQMLSLLPEHRAEVDATMLASCRASLDDAIDREEEHGWLWRSFSYVFPASWVALLSAPAWGAAALLIVGFSSGLLLGPRVLHRLIPPQEPAVTATTTVTSPPQPENPSTVTHPQALAPLNTADVAGISVLPSFDGALPQVQLQMKEQQPFTMQGTVNDDNVKGELINILRGGDRFCPDIRLDAVEALSSRTNDAEVRSALCHAVHKDKNAAVRLKALEALNGAEPQDIIQQTVLDALVDDHNPGVRVEAINSLRDMVAKGEVSSSDKMLSVLQDRVLNDPNAYIRLQSAAAIRDLGPRSRY
ncbi:MAG TPA: HEAT repeat domain-containing protein [Candidatus Acidoferrales bacterium]|nr:HEAT repeat domain-containing protein [Candidatus Acidoferrales bacterium]